MILFLLLAIIILIVLWISNKKKLENSVEELTDDLSKSNREKIKLSETIAELEKINNALSKYQGIVDIEEKAKEIINDAQITATYLVDDAKVELTNAVSEAKNIQFQIHKELNEARISANTIKAQANVDASAIKQTADVILVNATKEAKIIIDVAEQKAEEIAGNAYKAMQNATEFEKTAKAMKNIIEGYGDKYLVPTYSLLDELAEDFGHTEAGEKLKFARDKIRLMTVNKTAAKCDYVEENRKETAINFVIDAFNGKVDSTLSKVKKDNYGTLSQKIIDAYQIVNNHGKAFKNAAILNEYLNIRLEELKWAVITQELKWQEQEEQRRIKEQIREEEKARKEFEKAIREAQKEEETLKKLIEKAQKEVAQASDEQKERYEAKLRELEGKLEVAGEKNQRAISMAQQTKSGNVYVISNIGSFGENIYKIGMTRRLEPLDRIKELGDASVPFEFDVHAMIYSDNAPGLERELHKKFLMLQMNKVNPRKEFFKVTLPDIKTQIENMNISAKWTMVAEARTYRESLVIEKEISTNKQKQLEWENRQLQIDPVTVELDEEIES
jgi:hypothetical protein